MEIFEVSMLFSKYCPSISFSLDGIYVLDYSNSPEIGFSFDDLTGVDND